MTTEVLAFANELREREIDAEIKRDAKWAIPRLDRRYHAASIFTSNVMQALDPVLREVERLEGLYFNSRRRIHGILHRLFDDIGPSLITDADRHAAGLPRRDRHGYTREELHILEHRRLEAMRFPMCYVIPDDHNIDLKTFRALHSQSVVLPPDADMVAVKVTATAKATER